MREKKETLERFGSNYTDMPELTRKYIVLENDEYQYSVYDLLPFCEKYKIPLCIDFFHHWVWSKRKCERESGAKVGSPEYNSAIAREYNAIWELVPRVLAIWRERGIRPKCHLSEQRAGAQKYRDGAHSDCICEIPADIVHFANTNGVDIMLEVKMKDQCLRSVLSKQFHKTKDKSGRVVNLPIAY